QFGTESSPIGVDARTVGQGSNVFRCHGLDYRFGMGNGSFRESSAHPTGSYRDCALGNQNVGTWWAAAADIVAGTCCRPGRQMDFTTAYGNDGTAAFLASGAAGFMTYRTGYQAVKNNTDIALNDR